MRVTTLPSIPVDLAEFIEQMRILQNEYILQSVPVFPSLLSVNEPLEADVVLKYIQQDPEQKALLIKIS